MRPVYVPGSVHGGFRVIDRIHATTQVKVECLTCGSVGIRHKINVSHSKSCGCVNHRLTHGESKTRTYKIWENMIQRCTNPKTTHYHRYGGRGISVCKRWLEFSNFLQDMGHPPTSLHTIERKNNDHGYTPRNCKWATRTEQGNNRSGNHRIRVDGKEDTVTQTARRLGVSIRAFRGRIERGQDPQHAADELRGKTK